MRAWLAARPERRLLSPFVAVAVVLAALAFLMTRHSYSPPPQRPLYVRHFVWQPPLEHAWRTGVPWRREGLAALLHVGGRP